jgi:rhodanese-related sulfurtransferase
MGEAAPAQAAASPVAPLLKLVSSTTAPLPPPSPFEVTSADDVISQGELRALQNVGAPVLLADVRRETEWEQAETLAQGAVRLSPERPADDARRLNLPTDAWVVLYCNCPNEETSSRAARELKRRGWTRARALVGGWKVWQSEGLPVVRKPAAGAAR